LQSTNKHKLTRKQLVVAVANATGATSKQTDKMLDATLKAIEDALSLGDKVSIRGFGIFLNANRKQKLARDIRKKVSIIVPAHKLPVFKAADKFKKRVN
jgi:DNA-binding protein HU-beta